MATIDTEKEHKAAPNRIDELWDCDAETPETDELNQLAALVETYEADLAEREGFESVLLS